MTDRGFSLEARRAAFMRGMCVLRRPAVSVAPWALSLLVCSGCLVGSLHPLYDANSIVFDEGLLGDWEDRESEIGVTVARGEWRSYDIAFTDRFGTTRYNGHLTTIGAARFLNVLPHEGLDQPPFVIATNGFMQIQIEAARVRIREPEYGVVFKRLAAGKLGIPAAVDIEQNVVITAPSSKVRAWLAAALKDEALWAEWKTFTRSTR